MDKHDESGQETCPAVRIMPTPLPALVLESCIWVCFATVYSGCVRDLAGLSSTPAQLGIGQGSCPYYWARRRFAPLAPAAKQQGMHAAVGASRPGIFNRLIFFFSSSRFLLQLSSFVFRS